MRQLQARQRSLFCQSSNHRFSQELAVASRILDQHPDFNRWVYDDLGGGNSKVDTGVRGMTAEQVLRAAIIKQQNGWSYNFLELQCVDSEMTRAFLRLDFDESYSGSCLQENISKIKPITWEKVTHSLVQYAHREGMENGRMVRCDSTVVEANIHHPTDSKLLYDCIRVVHRALKVVRRGGGMRIYAKMTAKSAKHLVLKIVNSHDEKQRRRYYRKLLGGARSVLQHLSLSLPKIKTDLASDDTRLVAAIAELERISAILPRIIHQTDERVMKGKAIPSPEKIVSIFETHTDIIVKGRRDVEYGHKIFLTTGKSNLVLDCLIEEGNPSDKTLFMPLVKDQIDIFGRPPRQISADGGFASKENVTGAKDLGVKDVCFSKRCGLKILDMVKSEWVFQKLRNFRAGIEANISVLKRSFGLTRANWRGNQGFIAYVKSCVVAYNLTVLARLKLAD